MKTDAVQLIFVNFKKTKADIAGNTGQNDDNVKRGVCFHGIRFGL